MPYKQSLWQRLVAAEHTVLRLAALVIVLVALALLAWRAWRPPADRQPPASANATADQTLPPAELARQIAEAETASHDAETAATTAAAHGEATAALARLREALHFQEEANRLRVTNPPAAIQRRADLATQIARGEYAARLGEFMPILARATAASTPAEARECLATARRLAAEIGPRPPGNADDPAALLSEVEAGLASRFSRPLHAESLAQETAGQTALAAGHFAAAAEAFARAFQLQETINELHAAGADADFPRARALELRRDECLAQPRFEEIAARDRVLTLAQRHDAPAEIQSSVEQLDQLLEQLHREFPDFSHRYNDLAVRLDLVRLHRGEIADLRQQLLRDSIPLPGPGARRLLREPVDQALFALLAHDNPSRQPDSRRPVDSVTAAEADRFCHRLGWLLGLEVRLPQRAETASAPPLAGYAEWLREASPAADASPFVLSDLATQPEPATKQPPRSRRHTFRVVFSQTE